MFVHHGTLHSACNCCKFQSTDENGIKKCEHHKMIFVDNDKKQISILELKYVNIEHYTHYSALCDKAVCILPGTNYVEMATRCYVFENWLNSEIKITEIAQPKCIMICHSWVRDYNKPLEKI